MSGDARDDEHLREAEAGRRPVTAPAELDDDCLAGVVGGGNALGGNALGGNALGGNALGGNALGGNALGGNTLEGNALGGNALAGNALGNPMAALGKRDQNS